jgi:hypothetical protein
MLIAEVSMKVVASKRAKSNLARAGFGLMLGAVLLAFSCGGSPVEADRIQRVTVWR